MKKHYQFIFAILLACAFACNAQWSNGRDDGMRPQPPPPDSNQQRFDNKNSGFEPVSKPEPVQKPEPVPKPEPVQKPVKPNQPTPKPSPVPLPAVPQQRPQPGRPQPPPPPRPQPPPPPRPQPPPPPVVPQIVVPQSVIVPMYNDRIEDELEDMPRRGRTTPEDWTDDFNVAVQTAAKYNRPVLILFTGSDWCHWCKKLYKDVLSRDKFENFAERNLVLLYVDFPSGKRLPSDLQSNNDALAQRYGVRGYPHTVVINPSGAVLGRITGYSSSYVDSVREIMRSAGYAVRK